MSASMNSRSANRITFAPCERQPMLLQLVMNTNGLRNLLQPRCAWNRIIIMHSDSYFWWRVSIDTQSNGNQPPTPNAGFAFVILLGVRCTTISFASNELMRNPCWYLRKHWKLPANQSNRIIILCTLKMACRLALFVCTARIWFLLRISPMYSTRLSILYANEYVHSLDGIRWWWKEIHSFGHYVRCLLSNYINDESTPH